MQELPKEVEQILQIIGDKEVGEELHRIMSSEFAKEMMEHSLNELRNDLEKNNIDESIISIFLDNKMLSLNIKSNIISLVLEYIVVNAYDNLNLTLKDAIIKILKDASFTTKIIIFLVEQYKKASTEVAMLMKVNMKKDD